MNEWNELDNRRLRLDGVSEIHPDDVSHFLLLNIHPQKLRITKSSEEIEQFNEQVPIEEELKISSDEEIFLDSSYNIPDFYSSLDIEKYIKNKFELNKPLYSIQENKKAIQRIELELNEIKERDLTDFFRTIIYIIHVLQENSVVWGVGRGSSCASYILFILGLHVVDCVKFNISHNEFFHS